MTADDFLDDHSDQLSADDFLGPEPPRPITTGRSTITDPRAYEPQKRRGGTRSEARPYVASEGGSGAGSAEFAAVDPRRLDAPREPVRPLTMRQAKDDLLGGVEQVKALGAGVAAYGGAVDWRGAALALADLEGIEAGRPPMTQDQLLPSGRRVPGEPSPLAREYMASDPDKRERMRASLSQGLQRDEQFILHSVEAIKAYQAEQQRLSGRMPDFTDTRTLSDLGVWAVRNGLAATPSMAVTMVAAAAGGVPGVLAAGGGMAIGDLTQNRAEFAERNSDPARFTNPDRRDAATAGRTGAIARHLADNVGETAALTPIYAAADLIGPEGALAKRGLRAAAKEGIGKAIAGEAFGEGAQEAVNISGEMLAGERPNDVTKDDVKRVVNSAAVGGIMGAAGHVGTAATARAQDALQTRALTKAAEGGDLGSALELVARERGLPPITPVAMPERVEQPRQAPDQEPVKKAAPSVGAPADAIPGPADQTTVKQPAAPSVLDTMGVTRVDNGQRKRPARDADFADLADEIAQLEGGQAKSADEFLDAPTAPVQAAAAPEAAAVGTSPTPAAPDTLWTGKRGDGYATEEEAARQLPRRQSKAPEFDWTVEPRADGRWQLAGRKPAGETNGTTTTDPVRDGGDGTGSAGTAAAPAATPASRTALDDIIDRFSGERARVEADIQASERAGEVEGTEPSTFRATQLRLLRRQLESIPNPQRPAETSPSFEAMADAVEQLTGRRPVAYVEENSGSDGFTDGETAFVNLANPQRSVAFTAFHEHQHIVRAMAEGPNGDPQAKLATRMLDQVWGMIDDEGKRRYAEKYLFRQQVAGGSMTIEQALASPLLKNEMLSDFMGKRADDVAFWRSLARKDPKSFGSFAARWINTLKKLIDTLRGKPPKPESVKDVDAMIRDLERAKLVAERVLKAWADMNPRAAHEQGIQAPTTGPEPTTAGPDAATTGPAPVAAKVRNSAREADEYDAFNIDRMLDEDVDETVAMDDLEKLDGDVTEVPAGESRELSDEEMAELQAELADAAVPAVQRVRAPDDDMLKAAGIMAEAVYSDFEYVRDGGDRRSATITFDGRREHVFQLRALGDSAGSVNATPSQLVGAGSPLTLFGATAEGARAYNRRAAASIDLYLRKFDLYTAISAPARQRVAEAWEEISQLSGAFEFEKAARGDESDQLKQLQRIADEMLGDSKWTAQAGPAETARRGWSLQLTDAKAGLTASADIEYRGGAEPKLVMHTIDFTPSSGMGKPFYQVAFAFGDAIGVPTIADPSGLTGINTYRRTEQMMSAAARAGRAGAVSPGLGQRIYGWNARPKDEEQRQRNFVRIALAAARNAAELVPAVRDMAYDLATDAFSWRRGKGRDQDAEAHVKEALAGRDARAVGISRSTLARAAVTFAAIDGKLDLGSVRKVAKPILYSAREEVVDQDARSQYDGVMVRQQVRIADTGQVGTLTLDAGRTLRQLDQRAETFRRVLECLGR